MTEAPIRDVVRVEERVGPRGGRTIIMHLSCGCFLTRSSKGPPPRRARCIPCSVRGEDATDVIDRIAERVVRALYLYPHYRVDSRGPAGCLHEILRTVAPSIADELDEYGAEETYRRHEWMER